MRRIGSEAEEVSLAGEDFDRLAGTGSSFNTPDRA